MVCRLFSTKPLSELNQCCNIVNSFSASDWWWFSIVSDNHNGLAPEKVICSMSAILLRPPCFKIWTHWGRVTYICIGNLTFICSDNGLSPGRRQAMILTNVGILLMRPLGINLSEILIKINTFSFKKMHSKTSSAKWSLFHLGLKVLRQVGFTKTEVWRQNPICSAIR